MRWTWLMVFAALSGCLSLEGYPTADAGNDAGQLGNTVTGSLGFPVVTAVSGFVSTDHGPDPSIVTVYLASAAWSGICANHLPSQALTVVSFTVAEKADAGPVKAKTYTIDNQSPFGQGANGGVELSLSEFFPDGGYRPLSVSALGSITFTHADTTGVEGTFSALVGLVDGGTPAIAGTFNAPAVCQ